VLGALRSCRGAWHSNLTKIPLVYSVSHFNLGGLGALFGGLSPPKLPVATGLSRPMLPPVPPPMILNSQMRTKTFRDNCNINIVQQTSCEPLFPDVQMQLKMFFFVPFVRACMHHNYGVISASHACRDCVWPIIVDAELYTTCPGEQVLIVIRFNVTFPYLGH